MASDNCVYYHYFGEYGMDLCDHPTKAGDRAIYKGDCKKCTLKQGPYEGIEMCPFCGGRARVMRNYGTGSIRYEWRVKCDICRASIEMDSVREAIKAWNRRGGVYCA